MRLRLLFCLVAAGLCLVAAESVPRPEFPQPQFQREQWLTLNGPWEFEFDDSNSGLGAAWQAGASKKPFSKRITVPFAFETRLSGIGDTSFHPWVWYRRSVSLPARWQGRRVLLHFGAVDYRATVWVNGQQAGEHEGGNTPFWFDVTELLTPEHNAVITVRAEDPPTDRTIPRGKQYWRLQSSGIFYTRTSGIWQPVWLEAVGASYLSKVRTTPDRDGTVRFDADIARPLDGATLSTTIRYRNEVVASTMAALHGSGTASSLTVTDPQLWDVGRPNLYDVTFELRHNGQVLDRVQTYYGYRSVSADHGHVFLNGRPTYLKMVLDQGYWPDSTLTPPSDEAMQYDIRLAKEMGFNGARKHQKIEDPRWLYWADHMGFLVSGEIANAYLFTPDYVRRFTHEWIEAVERDYNHPSIIMWVPINESWGTPNLRDPQQQWHLKANYLLTKSLDPTRLVIDNDGWEHTDATDLFAIHDYAATGELLYAKYTHLDQPGTPFPDNSRAVLLPGYQYNHTPILLSEFGGIAFHLPGSPAPEGSWGYAGVEQTPASVLTRLRGLYEGIARIRPFVGICYTQLTDVEQEINGLLTYDRRPKFDVQEIKKMNDLLQ